MSLCEDKIPMLTLRTNHMALVLHRDLDIRIWYTSKSINTEFNRWALKEKQNKIKQNTNPHCYTETQTFCNKSIQKLQRQMGCMQDGMDQWKSSLFWWPQYFFKVFIPWSDSWLGDEQLYPQKCQLFQYKASLFYMLEFFKNTFPLIQRTVLSSSID